MFLTDDKFVAVRRQTPTRRLKIEDGEVMHREENREN
jgi:hypothetical protein